MDEDSQDGFAAKRRQLVEYISGFALKSPEVKNAFLAVRRESFLPKEYKNYSYFDEAIQIGSGQTISQPSTIAHMLELLGAKEGMRVLEVGSGSGYVIALLSRIIGSKGKVFGVECLKELEERAEENLKKEGIQNCELKQGDGADGWMEKAPFDRILVSCACPFIPKPLLSQLAERGRIVAPVGDERTQMLEVMEKVKGKPINRTFEGGLFVFVPMKGKHGFR